MLSSELAEILERCLNVWRQSEGAFDVTLGPVVSLWDIDGWAAGEREGTFVLPEAELKIYLTASVDTRANRRFDELVNKGEKPDFDSIRSDIEKRDFQDMNREIAPLKQAEDAVYLDSSDMTINEVVSFICEKAGQ